MPSYYGGRIKIEVYLKPETFTKLKEMKERYKLSWSELLNVMIDLSLEAIGGEENGRKDEGTADEN